MRTLTHVAPVVSALCLITACASPSTTFTSSGPSSKMVVRDFSSSAQMQLASDVMMQPARAAALTRDAVRRAPREAPQLVAAAISVAPNQMALITSAAIDVVPKQADAIRRAAREASGQSTNAAR